MGPALSARERLTRWAQLLAQGLALAVLPPGFVRGLACPRWEQARHKFGAKALGQCRQ